MKHVFGRKQAETEFTIILNLVSLNTDWVRQRKENNLPLAYINENKIIQERMIIFTPSMK